MRKHNDPVDKYHFHFLYKVTHDKNLDMNEMGGCWGGLVPGLDPPCSVQVLHSQNDHVARPARFPVSFSVLFA
jgi:hypothetical protein